MTTTVHYDYCDAHGRLCYSVIRRGDGPGKRFYIVDEAGQAMPNPLPEGRRILYRLPELLASSPADTIYLPEGEKDVEALVPLGLVATTMPCGTRGGWLPQYSRELAGRHVAILPDGDGPGQRHAAAVRDALSGVAASVVEIPMGHRWYQDASTWVAAKTNPAERLGQLVARERCRQAGLDRLPRRKADKLYLIRTASISTLAKLLLIYAAEQNDPQELPRKTVANLAEDCGCHRVTLQNTIAELREAGVLRPCGGRSARGICWDLLATLCPQVTVRQPSEQTEESGPLRASR